MIIAATHPIRSTHAGAAGVAQLLRSAVVMLLALLAVAGARAQLLDDVDLRRDGPDAVLQLRFVTAVQYQRMLQSRSGDQVSVYYRVLPTRQALDYTTAERRLPARTAGGFPSVTLTDEATTVAQTERRLLVRLSAPAKMRARAGRGDRSIEIVLEGRGAEAAAQLAAPAAAAPPTGRYSVRLETSTEAGAYLSAAIPPQLQDVVVYTSRRVEAGRTLYEIHMGPFDTRAAAEAALAALRPRFPQAAVVATEPAVATGAPTAAAAVAAAASVPSPGGAVQPAGPATAAASPSVTAPDTEPDRRAAALLATAREALARGDAAAAIEPLSTLLDLPPTASSREAQALIGRARLQAGDPGRARAEFEAFLRLYPQGPDADQVRAALAGLSPGEVPRDSARRPGETTTLTGSFSLTYYGGQSKVRTQEFQDSPLSGLPELVTLPTLAATDQKQVVGTADVNWRHRDGDVDQRAVFRDTYTRDGLRPEKTRNKVSALYIDQRWLKSGTSLRIGRQSPLGGGVLGRFDGVQASHAFRPRWKVHAVAGVPADTLLDTRRRFYGASIEAEALTPRLGGTLYVLQQTIDGQVDRRALGSDLRYFDGGLSGTAQLDYDVLLKGLNVASLQGTWQRPDNTVYNVLFDRRATPMLMLGNTLFFTDPNLAVRPTRVSELLATTPLQALRDRAKATTAMSTQASVGVTTPLNAQWQLGTDLRYTSTGAVAPVPDILPEGLPASGGIWSASLQLIGTNLYSVRDTHVLIVNIVHGPSFQGQLLSYNNSSLIAGQWQAEPSLKLYRQTDNLGTRSTRWSPGLRVTYRVVPQAAIESEANVESSRTIGPLRNESSTRIYFYVGGRYDF